MYIYIYIYVYICVCVCVCSLLVYAVCTSQYTSLSTISSSLLTHALHISLRNLAACVYAMHVSFHCISVSYGTFFMHLCRNLVACVYAMYLSFHNFFVYFHTRFTFLFMYIGRLCTRSIRLYSQKRYVSLHDIRLFSQYPRRYNIHVDVPLFSQDPQRTSPFVIYVSFCIIHVSLTRNLRLFSQKRYDSFRSVRLFFCNIHVSVDTFYMALLTQKVRCSYRPAAHSSTWLLVYMHCIHFSPKKNIHTFKKKKKKKPLLFI